MRLYMAPGQLVYGLRHLHGSRGEAGAAGVAERPAAQVVEQQVAAAGAQPLQLRAGARVPGGRGVQLLPVPHMPWSINMSASRTCVCEAHVPRKRELQWHAHLLQHLHHWQTHCVHALPLLHTVQDSGSNGRV